MSVSASPSWRRVQLLKAFRVDPVRAEDVLRDLLPAAQEIYLPNVAGRLKLRGDLLRRGLFHGPQTVSCEDALHVSRPEEIDKPLGHLPDVVLVDVGVDQRDRVLDQNRRARDDVFVFLPGQASDQNFVLVRDRDVADALLEIGDRFARSFIHYRDVTQRAFKKLLRGARIAFLDARVAAQRGAVNGGDVPLRAARSLRVGHQDLQAGPGQIRPVAYAERVARPDCDDHQRSGDDPKVLIRLPVAPDQAGLGDPGHIAFQRERGNVRLETAGDCARLRPAALIGLLKPDLLPGLRLPVFLEFGNDRLAVSLARRRIGAE